MHHILNRWLALALYLSSGTILVLAHGIPGTGAAFTALFICGSTLLLLVLGRWAQFKIDLCDLLFVAFLGCVAASFAVNGAVGDPKETVLLLLSLAGYPAGRTFSRNETPGPSFLIATTLIVALGCAVTIAPLLDQWAASYGKPHPLIFGQFGAGAAQFTVSLGFLIIALTSVDTTAKQRVWLCAALFIPATIFAASFVRFTFAAICAALLAAVLLGRRSERTFAIALICVLVASVAAGNAIRIEALKTFSKHADDVTTSPSVPLIHVSFEAQEDAPCPDVDIHSSIDIRKQLLRDALSILPHVGVFGIGMDRFMQAGCVKDLQVHNTLLQSAIEFGWPSAVVLMALLIIAAVSLWPLADCNREARLALCGLVFVMALSMAHGRISRDGLIFFFIGYAVAFRSQIAGKYRGIYD